MLSEPRAISFLLELELPPIEDMSVTKEKVRALYHKMAEPGGYQYENLDLQAEIPTMNTRRPNGGESICRFGGRKLVIEEKQPEFGVDGFIEVVRTVLQALRDGFGPIAIQRCRVECLAQPNNAKDSIVLLAGNLANVLTRFEPFDRPPSFFGVRFRFYPTFVFEDDQPGGPTDAADNSSTEPEGTRSGRDEPAAHVRVVQDADANVGDEPEETVLASDNASVTLRFETYSKDPSQIWMDVAAVYPMPIQVGDIDQICDNMLATYRFLTVKGKRFLEQFDVSPKQGDGGGE